MLNHRSYYNWHYEILHQKNTLNFDQWRHYSLFLLFELMLCNSSLCWYVFSRLGSNLNAIGWCSDVKGQMMQLILSCLRGHHCSKIQTWVDSRGLQMHVVICKCMQRFVFACLSSYAANHQSAVASSKLKHEITGLHAVLSPVNMVKLPQTHSLRDWRARLLTGTMASRLCTVALTSIQNGMINMGRTLRSCPLYIFSLSFVSFFPYILARECRHQAEKPT